MPFAPATATPLAQTPLQFVLNRESGNHDNDGLLAAVESVLGQAGRTYRLHWVASPQALPATVQAAAEAAGPGGTVVAVGGDGTINAVANGLRGHGVALALVPRGTFNYVARAHGIALTPDEALQQLLQGRAQAVQVGRVNGRRFLVNASLGLYPRLLQDREAYKRKFGRHMLVAAGAALVSLLRPHRRLRLTVAANGAAARELRVSSVFVGNNPLQIAALGLPEAEHVGRGALVALLPRAHEPARLLWMALRGAAGQLDGAADLLHFECQALQVRPSLPLSRGLLKVALDGEVCRLAPPLHFDLDPEPLQLVLPAPEQARPVA